MQLTHRLVSAAALTLLSASAFASTTTYTSSASFMANVAPGAYTETFTGMSNPPVGPALFSGNGFSYSASAPGDIVLSGGFLGASFYADTLTLNFGSNVTAVGGNFFATDYFDNFQAVSLTLHLNDGTTTVFTPTSVSDSYRAFTSDVAITSMTVAFTGSNPTYFTGLDNLTVGVTAVPEPASWALMGLGVAGLLAYRRRKA